MNQRMLWMAIVSTGIATLTGGCATIGPQVSSQEIEEAREELQVKGLLRLAEQHKRIWEIGNALLQQLPAEDKEGPYPELGIAVAKIDKITRKAFGYQNKQKGICVLAVREGGPVMTAGIQQGDLLVAINGESCSSVQKCNTVLGRLTPGSPATFTIKRSGEKKNLPVAVGSRPRKITFIVSHDQNVNAWAKGHEVGVTSGLMRFIESDDELAIVLGHELAHITGSHLGKSVGTGILASVIGLTLGVATEIAAPGVGNAVMQSTSGLTQAAFSRNFEREADYKGLLHVHRAGYDVAAGINVWERFGTDIPESLTADLRSTHPASPERMVRIRKIVQSIEEVGLEGTIARYEASEQKESVQSVEMSKDRAVMSVMRDATKPTKSTFIEEEK